MSSLTVMKYLHSLHDPDADAVAEMLRGPAGDCPAESPCGADMVKAIDGAHALAKSMDAAGKFDPESRWSIWWHAKECCETFYHG